VNAPKVTVVMPVYNGEKYLKEAIESILNQTFRDFEFIIIDGGSTDSSTSLLASYQQKDDRIRVSYQKNQRLVDSLNLGCQLAKGKYMARMDADDVSLPERLAKQVNYLETNPDIGVVGTWVEVIDDNDKPSSIWRLPTAPFMIRWSLIFGNVIVHSSVMMRRDVIAQLGFYRVEDLEAEDYDLWARASLATRVANVPEVLMRYRLWKGGGTSRRPREVEQYATRVSHSMIVSLLGPDVSFEAAANLRRVFNSQPLDSSQQIDQIDSLIHQLYRAYIRTNPLNPREVRAVARDAGRRLYALAALASKISLGKGFRILIQALGFNPRLILTLPWQLIKKGMRILRLRL
jgi:GT2 family glycosyltransferase